MDQASLVLSDIQTELNVLEVPKVHMPSDLLLQALAIRK